MEDHLSILKRVGLAFVALGLADIVFMIYCIVNGKGYSSSFNIFAVGAGIFLIRGSLRATRFVTWFSAFVISSFSGAILLLFPFLQPFGLFVAQVRHDPVSFITPWLTAVVVLVLLGWAYRQLRSPPVLAALQASGRTTAPPKLAFGLGIGLVAFLSIMLNMTLNGSAGDKAIELARQKLGPGYNYATQSLQWGGGHGRAVVVAYKDKEIKYVPVEWAE